MKEGMNGMSDDTTTTTTTTTTTKRDVEGRENKANTQRCVRARACVVKDGVNARRAMGGWM